MHLRGLIGRPYDKYYLFSVHKSEAQNKLALNSRRSYNNKTIEARNELRNLICENIATFEPPKKMITFYMRHFLLALLFFLIVFPLFSQEVEQREEINLLDSNIVKIDTASKIAKSTFVSKVKNIIHRENNFIVSPEFGRRPETGLLTGLYYLQLFKLSHKKDSLSRTSNVESYLDITARKQIIVSVRNNLLFKNEKFILRGINIYNKYPSLFWGIGDHSLPSVQELVSYNIISINQKLVMKINKKYFAGIQYNYTNVYNVIHPANDLFVQQSIPGANGSITSGTGLVFLYDSRDNIINSYKGFYLDASFLINQKSFGGQYNYNNVTVDVRKFIPLSKNKVRILALQGLINYNSGAEIPFSQMAVIGGDQIMRGYYTGRFRDKTSIAGQAEFRFLAWRKIGFTVFVAVAEVGPTFSTFDLSGVHYTYGGCFRYMINTKEHLNIGIDTGFGYQTNGLYFNSGEAF